VKTCYFKLLCGISTRVINKLSIDNNPISFSEVITGDNFDKWLDAVKD